MEFCKYEMTEKSPSVLGKEIISDSKGNLGVIGGALLSGCPNNEIQIRKKLNNIFFTLILFNEKSFRTRYNNQGKISYR